MASFTEIFTILILPAAILCDLPTSPVAEPLSAEACAVAVADRRSCSLDVEDNCINSGCCFDAVTTTCFYSKVARRLLSRDVILYADFANRYTSVAGRRRRRANSYVQYVLGGTRTVNAFFEPRVVNVATARLEEGYLGPALCLRPHPSGPEALLDFGDQSAICGPNPAACRNGFTHSAWLKFDFNVLTGKAFFFNSKDPEQTKFGLRYGVDGESLFAELRNANGLHRAEAKVTSLLHFGERHCPIGSFYDASVPLDSRKCFYASSGSGMSVDAAFELCHRNLHKDVAWAFGATAETQEQFELLRRRLPDGTHWSGKKNGVYDDSSVTVDVSTNVGYNNVHFDSEQFETNITVGSIIVGSYFCHTLLTDEADGDGGFDRMTMSAQCGTERHRALCSVRGPDGLYQQSDWFHLGLTFDGVHLSLYVNGDLAAVSPDPTDPTAGTADSRRTYLGGVASSIELGTNYNTELHAPFMNFAPVCFDEMYFLEGAASAEEMRKLSQPLWAKKRCLTDGKGRKYISVLIYKGFTSTSNIFAPDRSTQCSVTSGQITGTGSESDPWSVTAAIDNIGLDCNVVNVLQGYRLRLATTFPNNVIAGRFTLDATCSDFRNTQYSTSGADTSVSISGPDGTIISEVYTFAAKLSVVEGAAGAELQTVVAGSPISLRAEVIPGYGAKGLRMFQCVALSASGDIVIVDDDGCAPSGGASGATFTGRGRDGAVAVTGTFAAFLPAGETRLRISCKVNFCVSTAVEKCFGPHCRTSRRRKRDAPDGRRRRRAATVDGEATYNVATTVVVCSAQNPGCSNQGPGNVVPASGFRLWYVLLAVGVALLLGIAAIAAFPLFASHRKRACPQEVKVHHHHRKY